MHSWRVLVTPFLSGYRFYSQYDFSEPWNSPNNLALAKAYSWLGAGFSCPSARGERRDAAYMMIVGRCVSDHGARFRPVPTAQGIHVDDAIFVAEVADSGVFWTQPDDISISEMTFKVNDRSKAGVSSYHVGGAMVLCDDGHVEFVDEAVCQDTMRRRLLAGQSSAMSETAN